MRALTLLIGEYAISFREQLQAGYDQSGGNIQGKYSSFPIMYEDVNYLQKMNTDTTFLGNSKFTRFFSITNKSDPFLLTAATPYPIVKGIPKRKQISRLKTESKMIELTIPVPLLKRIKVIDQVLLNENKLEATEPNPESKGDTVNEVRVTEFYPINITNTEAVGLLEQYERKLSKDFAKSYCPLNQLIEISQLGYNPIWLSYSSKQLTHNLTNNDSLYGLAVLNIDPNSQIKPRVKIVHASTLNNDIRVFLSKLIDYIWTYINCEEIRVELIYYEQGDKLLPYVELKKELENLKFKWKMLTNDKEKNRAVVLGLNRPDGIRYNKGLDCGKEVITFKHAAVFTICNEAKEIEATESCDTAISLCCYLEGLREFVNKMKEEQQEYDLLNNSNTPFKDLISRIVNKLLYIVLSLIIS